MAPGREVLSRSSGTALYAPWRLGRPGGSSRAVRKGEGQLQNGVHWQVCLGKPEVSWGVGPYQIFLFQSQVCAGAELRLSFRKTSHLARPPNPGGIIIIIIISLCLCPSSPRQPIISETLWRTGLPGMINLPAQKNARGGEREPRRSLPAPFLPRPRPPTTPCHLPPGHSRQATRGPSGLGDGGRGTSFPAKPGAVVCPPARGKQRRPEPGGRSARLPGRRAGPGPSDTRGEVAGDTCSQEVLRATASGHPGAPAFAQSTWRH